MSRTPNYILKTPFYLSGPGVNRELPAGTFVRPISIDYVPLHVLEDNQNK